ncbi:MAG: peptide chain release factor N(5)-glutamine methyltransferase [Alteromonadaceae bacterium]|nr:peptide chain release factor N(5)-glutamine methyltransferase [Alteromonadaceae bacterium]
MQISEALIWGAQALEGGESPKLDCKVLLCHILDVSTTYLHTWPDKEITAKQLAQFEHCVARRKSGEPIAYITGERDFWSLTLKTNPSTLIPRPETELLVEQAIALPIENARCLDLGTGTGAIALAIASEKPSWRLVAVDRVAEAVSLAKQNAALNNIKNIELLVSNWFEVIPVQKFDIIVSNPPYVESNSPYLKKGDLRFEPISALASGADGLEDIEKIIDDSVSYLNTDGWLMLEHGWQQAEAIQQYLREQKFTNVSTVKDLNELDRITVAQLSVAYP